MAQSTLTIDLNALRTNWRNLNSKTACETAAVVKADSYGLGAGKVSQMLAQIGVRKFFVALAEEGVALRQALGDGPEIYVFSGHMNGDAEKISGARLTPMINSLDQMLLHMETLPGYPFGVQLDTGMNQRKKISGSNKNSIKAALNAQISRHVKTTRALVTINGSIASPVV